MWLHNPLSAHFLPLQIYAQQRLKMRLIILCCHVVARSTSNSMIDGVVNNLNHKCKIIPHDDQVKYYKRSQKKWERKVSKGNDWTVKNHADWIDENNFGISHFGLSPLLLQREDIWFDVFHLSVAITKRLMTHIRNFVFMLSVEFQIKFYNALTEFWEAFHLIIWKCNKNFSIFKGADIKKFVINCPAVVNVLRENLVMTKDI